jgi:PIN domain
MVQQSRRPVVIVDTTEFFKDPLLAGAPWLRTRTRTLKRQVSLWIPEVVIMEAVRHYRAKLDEHIAKLSSLPRLAWDEGYVRGIAEARDLISQLKEGYEQWLRDRLQRAGAEILPLPAMPHAEMAERAMREEKPFRMRGDKGPDGYRDMLLWASVVEFAIFDLEPDDTLILVTGNYRDFCDRDQASDAIAAALLADLGEDPPTVKRLQDLYQLDTLLPPEPEGSEELRLGDLLATDPHLRTALRQLVERECKALEGRQVADLYEPEDRSQGLDIQGVLLRRPRIRSLEIDLETIDVTVYGRDLDSDPRLYLVAVTVMADVIFDGYFGGAGNLEPPPELRQWRDVASMLVDFQFNARIADDGSIASLELERGHPVRPSQGMTLLWEEGRPPPERPGT